MKIKTNEEWAKKIINEGSLHLRKLLEDYPTAKPRIGVGFGKKEWRFITNFEKPSLGFIVLFKDVIAIVNATK